MMIREPITPIKGTYFHLNRSPLPKGKAVFQWRQIFIKPFQTTNKTLFVAKKMLSEANKSFSIQEKVLFIMIKMFFEPNKIISISEKMFSVTETVVSTTENIN
jgi:hypothetical protein